MTVKLEKDKIEFGDVHFNDVLNWETNILSGFEEIDYTTGGGCSCTDATIEGNKLKVKFTVKQAVGELKPNEYKVVPKYVDIYLDPTEKEFIADPITMKRTVNTAKRVLKIPVVFRAHGDLV